MLALRPRNCGLGIAGQCADQNGKLNYLRMVAVVARVLVDKLKELDDKSVISWD